MDINAVPAQAAMTQTASSSATPTPEDVLQATNQALIKKKQLEDKQNQDDLPMQNRAAISQAMAIVNPKGKDSTTQIGKSIQTPSYAGYCLQWVDDQQGNQNRYPTAIADYQAHAQAGNIQNSDKIPAGARVYFSPNDSNAGMGHVGISQGDGKFISATDNGIKTYSIQDWEGATGQSFLGWANTK